VSRARKGKRKSARRPPPRPETLQYKVRQGWKLENVQFAMRESSKRPAMAFVFLTRAGEPAADETAPAAEGRAEARAVDAWSRLAALAAGGDES